MRLVMLATGLAAVTAAAPAASAQGMCDDPSVPAPTRAPALDGFRMLFQQNGVTFYARVPRGEPPLAADVAIRNGNSFPVEVSYSVVLDVTGESLPRSVGIGRHCAQIPPQWYVVSTDSISSAASGLRIRNLTIANLVPETPSPVRAPEGSAAPAAPAGPAPGAAPPAAQLPESVRVGPAPADAPPFVSETKVGGGAAPRMRHPRFWQPVTAGGTVADLAREAAYAVAYLLSATLLTVAGLGLVLPIVGAFAVLLTAAAGLLFGRGRSESEAVTLNPVATTRSDDAVVEKVRDGAK